jgi:hypothetical protein
MNCGVQPLRSKVYLPDPRCEMHRNVRVAAQKARQARHQPAGAEGGQYGQRQLVGAGPKRQRGVPQLAQSRTHGVSVIRAFRRGHHIARAALQKSHAKLTLQRCDLPRHSRLRQRQFLCCGGKAAKAGHSLEGLQRRGGGQIAAGRRGSGLRH